MSYQATVETPLTIAEKGRWAVVFLGVDGGGTKTSFALVSGDGKLLAATTRGPSHPDQVGMEGVAQTLTQGVHSICAAAGIAASQIRFGYWGLPGYGENLEHIPQLHAIIENIMGKQNYRCGNDVEAGWAGSLAGEPGVHIVAGTGAIGFGVDPKGQTARASGWGELFGDEGSAYWLGRRLLELFGKQSDGRMPKTQLYELVKAARGLTRDLDLLTQTETLYQRRELAKLAQVVYQAAVEGDPHALDLFREAAYEHSLIAKAIIHQLEFPPGFTVPVSYSGGVFRAGRFVLDPLAEYLQPLGAVLVEPKLGPLMGACLYAMKLSGTEISSALVQRLQEAEKALAD